MTDEYEDLDEDKYLYYGCEFCGVSDGDEEDDIDDADFESSDEEQPERGSCST